jgi:hypothetical protein
VIRVDTVWMAVELTCSAFSSHSLLEGGSVGGV